MELEPGEGGSAPCLALTRPSIMELQTFEVAFLALAALSADGSLARISAAAVGGAAAGEAAAVTVESMAARGEAEPILVEIQLLAAPPLVAAGARQETGVQQDQASGAGSDLYL